MRLKFIIVIVQSKNEIVKSMQIVQVRLELLVKLFQRSFLNGCFFVNFQKSFFSEWLPLRFNLSFFKFFINGKQPPEMFCKKALL